ncbi:MAG: acyl-CoA dehydrogenase [Acidimicrobiia bacterium]|nr:acyl-CoA dehydrogenase [Acidimicrobiia bacterium]MXY74842.1 acyl-CoA dehydrogenase [Acidimicrobiia bacterium]MYA38984.1 acyl-CoA dehydrogenase [Acidimicrobiia bacterium]MYB78077.1 acyl-CoA dehydrogenase [Acidimicrobiia bacterium]MYK55612.1 acyl-CoA dehydrogenase [Acidimicrobiia bacterium]
MSAYRPPLRDIGFVLEHIVDLEALSKLNGYQHADPATVGALLEEAGRFFSEVVAPLNRVGDLEGSVLTEDGAVKTPTGFAQAYRKLVAAGWQAISLPADWGGGGMPQAVGFAVDEMMISSSLSFSLCPTLTTGTVHLLNMHGSPEQKGLYLEKLVTGEWSGTMNLTEPQAGSDVGALTTRAVPHPDGTYRITGTKIFITWGDHDMADNIIHTVLARTPGAADGTKGISLFLVPKRLVGPDGEPGELNDVRTVSLEHKMGIHGSPTCMLSYGEKGGAVGYLVGPEQGGMARMFTMMNAARIAVGQGGLAVAERAYQKAWEFAWERRQGRAVGAPGGRQSLIVEHPDVRRMLATMKARIEAMRSFLFYCVAAVDRSNNAETDEERTRAGELVSILTPVAKAWCSDLGVEVASLGIQIHGGMGFVEETGAAQFFRDSRISPIYEGTNGIQAIDLVMRKLPIRTGAAVKELLEQVSLTAAEASAGPELAESGEVLARSARILGRAGLALGSHLAKGDYRGALAGAYPYLTMFGTVMGGWLMVRSAQAAQRKIGTAGADDDWLRQKVATARYYCEQLLPEAASLEAAASAGSELLYELDFRPEMAVH